MDGGGELPVLIDVEQPSQARIYDYLLGGSLNFAADRQAARELIAMVPDVPLVAQANRAFLRRAVRFLAEAGIRQFLDIGSGVPTRGNVHEIVQQTAPDSTVVYVDIDPVAVAHGREVLRGQGRVTALQEDARRPDRILNHSDVRALLDLDRPVGLVLVSVLHFIADVDDPAGIVDRFRDAVVPGSYLVLSHLTAGYPGNNAGRTAGEGGRVGDDRRAVNFASPRSLADVQRFFAGFELVEPGLVPIERWRPDSPAIGADHEALACMHAGVGRKR